jgi:hypothetical protein
MTDTITIHQAIASAIGEVRKIGKTDRNKFDGYDFASIDKFLEMVNPICATHRLFPFITQEGVEFYENTNSKGGKSVWARFTFRISLFHASGGEFGPALMMVAVPMTGAQSSGSAQSYALKQFFRGVFMIPTGDKDDADLNPNEAHTTAPQRQPQGPNQTAVDNAVGYIEEADDMADLLRIWKNLPKDVQAVPAVIAVKDARKVALDKPEPRASDDIKGDEIPY